MKKSVILALIFSASPALAAPPKVDFLFPAGGQRGQKLGITLGGAFDPWPVECWASHPGLKINAEKSPGKCLVAIAPEVPCGTHWLRFFNKDGASSLRPFLVNQVPEVLEREPNDEPKKAQELKEPTVIVNGRLEKLNDTDVFLVHLKKGQTLVAALQGHHTLRSPMDAVLQVVSPEGFVLAQNDDFHEMDPLIAFPVPRDGAYLVRVFCFPAVPDSRVGFFGKDTCIYRLTLTTGPFLDHAWPLAVERSKPGEVELIGWNIPPEKRKAAVSPDKDKDFAFVQPPGFANGTLVRVEGHPTLLVGPDPIRLPATLSGKVNDGRGAKIRFEAKKGLKTTFQVEARELHFPLDPVLILTDPAGKQLQRVQSAKLNADPLLEFTPATEGVHTLEVRDLHEEVGPRHVFRLRALPALPDFEVGLSGDWFLAAAGKGVDIPISLNRRNGLAAPIEFSAEGLPPGFSLEQGPGKDKKGLTLRVLGLKEPGNFPFRLWAQVQGKADTRRAVQASLPELNASVPDLWLTVGKTEK